jgi:hypothetical protein
VGATTPLFYNKGKKYCPLFLPSKHQTLQNLQRTAQDKEQQNN